MIYIYNKLVRDNIVKIIEDKGSKARYEILDINRYEEELENKLKEEVNEYIADHSIEELADILEVFYAILEHKEITMEEVELARIKKKWEKGSFENRVFLIDVED